MTPSELIILQLTKKNKTLKIETQRINLNDLTEIGVTQNKLPISSITNSIVDKNEIKTAQDFNFSQYEYSTFKGENLYVYLTLGSRLSFKYENELLHCQGNTRIQTDKINITKRITSLVSFKIDYKSDNILTVKDISTYPLEYKKYGNVENYYALVNNGEFHYVVIYKKGKVVYKNHEKGNELDDNTQVPIFFNFQSYKSLKSQLNAIKKGYVIHETKDEYVIIEQIMPSMLTTVKKIKIFKIKK